MFRVDLDEKICKVCGLCADFCPTNVFDYEVGGVPVVVRIEDCTGCKKCETICPDFVIEVKRLEGAK